MRRVVLLLLPLSLILTVAAAIAYFVWWDATHCTLCRTRVDTFGRCPNQECHLHPGHLSGEMERAGGLSGVS